MDFSSNDYLGLATSPRLAKAVTSAVERGVPIGSGGSRLLRGNDPEHEALEAEAAQFFGAETALYMGGGFAANTAIFSTLPERGDLIVFDELIHASVRDGMRSSKAVNVSARHNEAQSFEDEITRWRASGGRGRPWIAVESLYSMDGDRAPLDALAEIASRHDCMLVIDEAHATGVLGPEGRGLGAHLEACENVVSLHTCGKALGVMGGLVLGSRSIRDFLVNRARPFIYATAPSPILAAAVREALAMLRDEPERREQLAARVSLASRLITARAGHGASGSQILPIVVGTDARATSVAARMQSKGFDIRAVRPPTVPEGTARLRISITLNATENDIDAMTESLAEALSRSEP